MKDYITLEEISGCQYNQFRVMEKVKLIKKKGSTLHDYPYRTPGRKCDYPYRTPGRKCPHFWIINVTPPGPAHCIHHCLYCYARQAIYSDYSAETLVYSNLPELVEKDLKKITLCPPISISNVSDPCQPIPELRSEVKRLTCPTLPLTSQSSLPLP